MSTIFLLENNIDKFFIWKLKVKFGKIARSKDIHFYND